MGPWSMEQWTGELEKRLTQRDAQVAPFLALIKSQTTLLQAARTAKASPSQDQVADKTRLQAQIAVLEAEQAQLYKGQAQTAARLLEALDRNSLLETQNNSIQEERARQLAQIEALQRKSKDLADAIKEKEGVIQILQDELSTHQLELVHKEAKLEEALQRTAQLESENKTLVDRWMAQKQKEASEMNEANEFLGSALNKMKFWTMRKRPTSVSLDESVVSNNSPGRESLSTPAAPRATLPTCAVKKFTAHESDITCIQVSPDGRWVATGANDKNLILYEAGTGGIKSTLSGALQGIMSVAFNQVSDSIMGASNDNSIKLWALNTFRLQTSLTGHVGKVYSAKFLENFRAVSGSHDRTIKIWDLTKGYCIKTLFTLSSCNDLAPVDYEGNLLVSGHLDNNVRIWDAKSGNSIQELTGIHAGQVTAIEIMKNRNQFLTTSRDNTLKLIDLRKYEVVCEYTHEQFKVGINWAKSTISPDGAYIASGSANGSLFIWNAYSTMLETQLKEHSGAICGAAWSPLGGPSVYTADKDKQVVFWGDL